MGHFALDDRRQLTKEANKLLEQNLLPGEPVRVIIRGTFSSSLIATDRRAFVYKQGMMGGAMFGKKLTSYDYRNLTGVHLETGVMSGVFALEGPGITSQDLSYWHQGKGDPKKAPHALGLNRDHFDQAKQGAALLRQLISASQQSGYGPQPAWGAPTQPTTWPPMPGQGASPPMAAAPPPGAQDGTELLRKLGELRDAGVLTPTEFEAKKQEVLRRL